MHTLYKIFTEQIYKFQVELLKSYLFIKTFIPLTKRSVLLMFFYVYIKKRYNFTRKIYQATKSSWRPAPVFLRCTPEPWWYRMPAWSTTRQSCCRGCRKTTSPASVLPRKFSCAVSLSVPYQLLWTKSPDFNKISCWV